MRNYLQWHCAPIDPRLLAQRLTLIFGEVPCIGAMTASAVRAKPVDGLTLDPERLLCSVKTATLRPPGTCSRSRLAGCVGPRCPLEPAVVQRKPQRSVQFELTEPTSSAVWHGSKWQS